MIGFKSKYVLDDEICLCGSNRKYKECCKFKNDVKVNEKEKIVEIQKMFTNKKYLLKTCLFPGEKKCTKKSIHAHALQNNRILSLISEKDHVIILNRKKKPMVIDVGRNEKEVIYLFDKESVNKATAYDSFCKEHDDKVFAPIEKQGCDFNKDNDEQKYIYAYKAFIFEYYKELATLNGYQKNLKRFPSMMKDRRIVSFYRQQLTKLKEFEYYKKFFDNGIINKEYKGLKTKIIELNNTISFANFSCISPSYDLNGKRIKSIPKDKRMRRIFLTVLPTESKSYILCSYLEEDEIIYRNFLSQLNNKSLNNILTYFNYIIPLYSDNLVISPKMWHAFSEEQQMMLTFLANRIDKQFYIFDKAFSCCMKNAYKRNIEIDYRMMKINLFQ